MGCNKWPRPSLSDTRITEDGGKQKILSILGSILEWTGKDSLGLAPGLLRCNSWESCLPGVTQSSNLYICNQHSEEMLNISSLLWKMLKSETVKIRSVHKAGTLLNYHYGNCFWKGSVTNVRLFCLIEVPVN